MKHEYFAKMLNSTFREGGSPEISMKTSKDIAKILLRMLYQEFIHERFELNPEEMKVLPELMSLVDYLQLDFVSCLKKNLLLSKFTMDSFRRWRDMLTDREMALLILRDRPVTCPEEADEIPFKVWKTLMTEILVIDLAEIDDRFEDELPHVSYGTDSYLEWSGGKYTIDASWASIIWHACLKYTSIPLFKSLIAIDNDTKTGVSDRLKFIDIEDPLECMKVVLMIKRDLEKNTHIVIYR